MKTVYVVFVVGGTRENPTYEAINSFETMDEAKNYVEKIVNNSVKYMSSENDGVKTIIVPCDIHEWDDHEEGRN